MIDTNTEQIFPLVTTGDHLPGGRANRVNRSTPYRWVFKGVRGVKLETICIGGTRWTSREALERFFQATTKAADAMLSTPASPAESKPAQARQAAVDRELAKRRY